MAGRRIVSRVRGLQSGRRTGRGNGGDPSPAGLRILGGTPMRVQRVGRSLGSASSAPSVGHHVVAVYQTSPALSIVRWTFCGRAISGRFLQVGARAAMGGASRRCWRLPGSDERPPSKCPSTCGCVVWLPVTTIRGSLSASIRSSSAFVAWKMCGRPEARAHAGLPPRRQTVDVVAVAFQLRPEVCHLPGGAGPDPPRWR